MVGSLGQRAGRSRCVPGGGARLLLVEVRVWSAVIALALVLMLAIWEKLPR